VIESIAKATHHHTGEIVGFALFYSFLRFLEGYGLWRERHWAEWFAAISAGLYLPLEIQHVVHRPGALNAVIIVVNVLVVVYLVKLLKQQHDARKLEALPSGY
jgi:uncharacterized membrane protein (DUF2068 family)